VKRALALALVVAAGALPSSACDSEGCLRGEEGCTVPSACLAIKDAFEGCQDPSVRIARIGGNVNAPGGLDAVGADGDWLLENGRVQFVIDALEHPQHLSPTGGAILDASTRGGDDDSINHVFQAAGALPTDAVRYLHARVIEDNGLVALQLDGHLVGDERQRVHTRYELRACEPGLRVRTEMVNGSDDTVVWSNADGYWWGGRSMLPFTPGRNAGYLHPAFGLSTLNDVMKKAPFIVGTSHSEPASAFATIPCNVDALEGFHSDQVSASGTPRRIVPPRDFEVFERFFALAHGSGAAPGVDVALAVRRALFDEAFVTVRGRIVIEGGFADAALGSHARAALLVSEGWPAEPAVLRTSTTEAVPSASGAFLFRVPAGRPYVVERVSFGERTVAATFIAGDTDVDLGDLAIPAAARIEATVRVDGELDHALLLVLPADDETAARTEATWFDVGAPYAPLLGAPAAGSPAGNRVLVNGLASFALPEGRFEVWATAGIGASVARAVVDALPGETAQVELSLLRHPQPGLSADFHVHGAASFDSTLPDLDRVRAFLASGVDVIAATDHDAVWDYAQARRALNADARIALITGLETTGQVLFAFNPSVYFPQVIGHWNFWPVPFDDDAPRNGAPWDELVEPGALFDRVAARGFRRDTGIIQLNHPWADLEFARDLGFPRALGLNLDEPLPTSDDGTAAALFLRTPEGASFSNADYDTQEVMNGTKNGQLLQYRAFWFYLLQQGIVRVGTANSDSHSLTDNILGTPRNIVLTDERVASFDVDAFNADVKAGRVIGTNGPFIEAFITDGAQRFDPGTRPHTPGLGATLTIVVHAPAWVPVREVRILVNGAPIVIGADDLDHPEDPFAAGTLRRLATTIELADILPAGNADAWIVIEAGDALPLAGDLDCDGVPDTSDNNGDGRVDTKDVDRNGDGTVDDEDLDVTSSTACGEAYGSTASADRPRTGPLENPPPPARDSDAWPFFAVTPGGYPFAFTNPLLIDSDGDGFEGPGL
jgi:hypothetical protein